MDRSSDQTQNLFNNNLSGQADRSQDISEVVGMVHQFNSIIEEKNNK